MIRIYDSKKYGRVEFRNAMLDLDDTNLEEGIEITFDDGTTDEVYGYYDLAEQTEKQLEKLLN